MRVVLDTNVWISGMLWEGPPHEVVRLVADGELVAVTSPGLIEELRDVLARPKLAARRSSISISVAEVLELVAGFVQVVSEPRVEPVITADPDDDVVLACALAGAAEQIVTGDPHLLRLGEHRGVKIVTPRELLDELRAASR